MYQIGKLSNNVVPYRSTARGWEQWCFYAFLVCFVIKSVYFALNIGANVFPDETSWLGMIHVFSRSFLLPIDSPESYPFGLITHIPNLYFFLLGKLLCLNVFSIPDLIFLRLANVSLGLCTIICSWKLVCLVSSSAVVRLLFVALLTNTLMFTFMYGAVSYDNLTNLLAVVTLYFFLKFLQRKCVDDLFVCVMAMLAGVLTKITMLPFAAGLAVVFLWFIVQAEWHLVDFVNWHAANLKIRVISTIICLLFLAMAINLYAGNWLRYSALQPRMENFLSFEDCLQNGLFVRMYVVDKYKHGEIELIDAQRLAVRIRKESDRKETLMLLRCATRDKNAASLAPLLGRGDYILVWGNRILAKIYGIMAHKSMEKRGTWDLLPYYWIIILGMTGFILNLRRLENYPLLMTCAFIGAWYLLILSQLVNYRIYHSSGIIDLALHGRYIFPVLVPIYVVLATGVGRIFTGRLRFVVVLTVTSFLIVGEFPWFLQHVTPGWYFK